MISFSVAAPLALTLGAVSSTEKSIEVTWTKADGTNNPTEYSLMIGTETIGKVAQTNDAKFTFTKEDAAGTLLKLDTDYQCKISATIAAFDSCDEETVTDTLSCKISSNNSEGS